MKQSIQKTARIGLSLFLLVGLLAGILALSGAQPVHAWGPVIVVDDFNTGAFTLTGPNNSIMGVSTAGAIGGDRDVIILDSPATAGNHPVPSVMSLTEGDGYLNLAVGNQPYMYAIEWGRGLLEWDSGMHSANALNLDVSNHDRIIVTLSEAPSSGSIGVGIYKAGGHFSFIFSPQSLSGAGEYTFLMSYLDNYVDYQNVEGIRLYFTGMPASSTIRVDSMVIRSQPCPAGQYDNGSGCVDADPGYYVPDAGATSQIPCLAGYYQDQAGATSCKPASAGSYVSTTGATSATFCPAGKYQPYVGQTSCIPADPGYYVPGSGAIEQLMCEVGYTSDAGAVECYKINTAPTANAGGPYLGAVNTSIAFDGSASSDHEADALTYAWDLGDGSSGTGVMPSNSYIAAGIYTVCLTVNDGALSSEANCTMAVVYDPSAGFVTGGGWIDSPAGALVSNPDASGKGNFGFNTKYKKNGSLESETEFELHVGEFHFHSSNAQWMYISGAKAQFFGQGSVEESSHTYGFSVTVLDGKLNGGEDMFRIRIWDMDNGNAVVYDTQPGDSIYADPNTPLGGGSIVIHKGKK